MLQTEQQTFKESFQYGNISKSQKGFFELKTTKHLWKTFPLFKNVIPKQHSLDHLKIVAEVNFEPFFTSRTDGSV